MTQGGTESPAKSTKTNGNILSGLGLLQLLPSLLQGCTDLPPRFQVLLEGAVSGAVLTHQRQVFLLDIGQPRTTLLGVRQIVRRGGPRGAAAAQETLNQRSGQHGL